MSETTDLAVPDSNVPDSESQAEASVPSVDLNAIFLSEQVDRDELFSIRKQIFTDDKLLDALIELVDTSDKASARKAIQIKLGFAHWILNQYSQAIAALEAACPDANAEYFLGLIHLELDNNKSAHDALERASKKEDNVDITCALIEAKTKLGESEESLKALDKLLKSNGDSAEVHYQRGIALDFTGEYEDAIDSYQNALDVDVSHAKSAFRIGYMLALRGQEEEALQYYQRCEEAGPAHSSVFMNIGLLYEDARQYEKAVNCYEKVVKGDPANQRARLYLKDALASLHMYYDEDRQKELELRSDILKLPIADFELSIRCRTALETIGISLVGDLVTRTEEELLSCKNFGDTSLQEIKLLLTQNNLRLGMTENEIPTPGQAIVETPGEDDELDKLVNELDLSVRSRRCMERLGIVTLRDLTDKSERELLSGKNFGRTSLREIKEKLGTISLSLAEDS